MASGNPVFSALNSNRNGGYAGFSQQQAYAGQSGYPGYTLPAASADRPMTLDDVVTKTSITLGVALLAGALTVYFNLVGFAVPALIVGLVLSLIVIFTQSSNPALILAYAAAEGVFLGALTGVINQFAPGVALQAVIGTFGVFAGMLALYKSGVIRVTPRLTKWIIGATIGAAVLMLANLVFSLFGLNLGIRSGSGPISIVFSLVVIGIAAFNFLLDFEQASEAIQRGRPARFAWYIAFGLTVTLVWLYLEILRLLASLQRN